MSSGTPDFRAVFGADAWDDAMTDRQRRVWKARRLRRARLIIETAGPPKCGAWTPGFVGYQCELRRRHSGEHEAVTSRTTTTDWRGTRESGRTTRRWPR